MDAFTRTIDVTLRLTVPRETDYSVCLRIAAGVADMVNNSETQEVTADIVNVDLDDPGDEG